MWRSRPRFTENETVLSQFMKNNEIGVSCFMEKRRTFFFKQKLYNVNTVTFGKATQAFVLVDDLGHLLDALPPLWLK